MILSTMKHEYLNQMNREGSTKESSFEEVVVICKRLFDWWNSTTVENSIDFSWIWYQCKADARIGIQM